jgi:hypothetical protein
LYFYIFYWDIKDISRINRFSYHKTLMVRKW